MIAPGSIQCKPTVAAAAADSQAPRCRRRWNGTVRIECYGPQPAARPARQNADDGVGVDQRKIPGHVRHCPHHSNPVVRRPPEPCLHCHRAWSGGFSAPGTGSHPVGRRQFHDRDLDERFRADVKAPHRGRHQHCRATGHGRGNARHQAPLQPRWLSRVNATVGSGVHLQEACGGVDTRGFWQGGKTSHCGSTVRAVREESGWRIASMMWTVEPEACPALRPSQTRCACGPANGPSDFVV